jgi:hypothetical protein
MVLSEAEPYRSLRKGIRKPQLSIFFSERSPSPHVTLLYARAANNNLLTHHFVEIPVKIPIKTPVKIPFKKSKERSKER